MVKSPAKAAKWAARSERLAAALRQNLKRRKVQARARDTDKVQADEPENEPESEPDGGPQPEFRRNRTAP